MFNSIFKAFSDILRVSKIVSLKSWLHFGFGRKGVSHHPHIPPQNYHFSSPLQSSEYHNLVRADPDYLKRKLTAFSDQPLLLYLRCSQGTDLVKLIFVSQKEPSNSIQKLFITEAVSIVIVKSYLLYSRI